MNRSTSGAGLPVRVCILLAALPLAAQDARQIVTESQTRSRAHSEQYEGLLQVIDSSGKISAKRWTYIRIGSYGDSKAVIRFTNPPEVRGVALLIVNHTDRASDQWMWTPALNRERHIALQDRSTRFFGTDFSFEDLEEQDVGRFEYVLRGEESVSGIRCWHVESKPKQSKYSQYTSSHIWIRQVDYVPMREESYVREMIVRRLDYSDIEQIQGVWLAKTLAMHDLRRNSRTILKFDKLQLNVPVEDSAFTVQALRVSGVIKTP